MTAGDVIQFTVDNQHHPAVVMPMTDDDFVLLDYLDGDPPARAGISSVQEAGDVHPRIRRGPGCRLPTTASPPPQGRSCRGRGGTLVRPTARATGPLCTTGSEDLRPDERRTE